jgi:hypothetical protein
VAVCLLLILLEFYRHSRQTIVIILWPHKIIIRHYQGLEFSKLNLERVDAVKVHRHNTGMAKVLAKPMFGLIRVVVNKGAKLHAKLMFGIIRLETHLHNICVAEVLAILMSGVVSVRVEVHVAEAELIKPLLTVLLR